MGSLFAKLAIGSVVASNIFSPTAPVEAPQLSMSDTVQANSYSGESMSDQLHNSPEDDVISDIFRSAADTEEYEDATYSPNSSSTVKGVDISGHQHNKSAEIDIDTVLDEGNQDFGIVKATEGTTYKNPHFRNDVIKFIENDAPVGFYHYARPSSSTEDAKEQARFFVSVTGISKGVRSLPPILDLEETEGLDSDELIEWTQAFVDEIEDLTGRKTMIYTYPHFWMYDMGNTTQFSDYPLWLASYNNLQEPDVPGGWDDWLFWQYSASEKIDGYNADIDANFFRGSLDELKELYRVSPNKESQEMVKKAIAKEKARKSSSQTN